MMFPCQFCFREFKSERALSSHINFHNIDHYNRVINNNISRSKGGTTRGQQQISEANVRKIKYSNNPKFCQLCNLPLPYQRSRNKFCSQNCSAIFSNNTRDKSSYISKNNKIANCGICNSSNIINNKRSIKTFICNNCKPPYLYSKIISCKICKTLIKKIDKKMICENCQPLKWQNNKDQYSFKFNVFEYPDLFDLELLKNIGWVSFGGKRGGTKNLEGLSRDHKVSVSNAKKYGYDPYYISHPCNCELMTMPSNNKKNSNSSITYEDLKILVDSYDAKLHSYDPGVLSIP